MRSECAIACPPLTEVSRADLTPAGRKNSAWTTAVPYEVPETLHSQMGKEGSLTRFEGEMRALESALAEFEHESRRVRDQLERYGGHSFALESRLKHLEENIATTRRDLERVRAKLRSDTGANS